MNLVSLGKIAFDSTDFSALENEIGKAAASQSGIICHELFIDESGEFYMILLVKA